MIKIQKYKIFYVKNFIFCFSAPKDEDYAPCGTITSDAIIASPNFPELYPTEASCTWIVQFDEGEQVQLEFTDFNVEWSYKCK